MTFVQSDKLSIFINLVLTGVYLPHNSCGTWVISNVCDSICDQPHRVDVSTSVRSCCTHFAVPKGYLPDAGLCNGFHAFCYSTLDQPMSDIRDKYTKLLYVSGLSEQDKIVKNYKELLGDDDNLLPVTLLDVDTAGIEFIMEIEGFSDSFTNQRAAAIGQKLFQLKEPKHVIGYGVNCTAYGDHCNNIYLTDKITQEDAVSVLKSVIKFEIERAIKGSVKAYLSQDQFNALASFVYHIGEENFKTSKVLNELNAENFKIAAAEIYSWNVLEESGNGVRVSEDLKRRREKETDLFCKDGMCTEDEWDRDEL